MTNVRRNSNNDITNHISNNMRADYDRLDAYEDRSINISNSFNITNSNNNVNIYRYKFTDEFTNELYTFSKIHQYDHRKDFKEAWTVWIKENEEIVNSEVRRLTELSYDGDIIDKMFKSARYYFRKKSTEKKEPKERRAYQSVSRKLLDAIDLYLKNVVNNNDFKPSNSFDMFCKENIILLKEEVTQLCKNGFTDSEEIKNKIKKTYKNRYFILISK